MVARLRNAVGPQSLIPVVLVALLALGAVGLWHFMAQPTPLPAAEVRGQLSGNTAGGRWPNSSRYLLYFDPDGAAVYREPDKAAIEGSWRVADDGMLCLAFPSQPETCYGVARESGSLVWIQPGSGRTFAFNLNEGRDPSL
jgi:hypothetical protein